MNLHKFNPIWWFLNDDDPLHPHDFKPNWPELGRWLYWTFVRNPLHNFMFYVVGFADEVRDGKAIRYGIEPMNVFRVGGGVNATYFERELGSVEALLLGVICVLLIFWLGPWRGVFTYIAVSFIAMLRPFVSYQNRWVKAYIGWRERGNFGIKLTPGGK